MSTQPTLLVLAAGMGNRYGGLKQLDGVGPHGETILEYSVYDALRAGFGRVVFVIRPDIETAFQEQVAARFADRIPLAYVYQTMDDALPAGFEVPEGRQKPWGTGHAILVAASVIQEPFAAINADDLYGVTAFQLMGDFLRSARDTDRAEYAMVGYMLRNTLSAYGSVARGICQLEGEYLRSVVELTKIEPAGQRAQYTDPTGEIHRLFGEEIVSLNFWGFTASIFGHLRTLFQRFLRTQADLERAEFYIPTVVGTLVEQGLARVRVLPSQEPWLGVTYRADKPHVVQSVRRLVDHGVYPEKLWS